MFLNSFIVLAIVVLFIVLASNQRAQEWTLSVALQLLKIVAMVVVLLCCLYAMALQELPPEISEFLIVHELATTAQLDDTNFWMINTALSAGFGVISIIALSSLRNIVRIHRHLDDLEKMIGKVSEQIPEARRNGGQGSLGGAIDTMTNFFQR